MIVRSKANELLKQLYTFGSGSSTTYGYIGLSTTTPDENGNNFTEPALPSGVTGDDSSAITVNEYKRVSLKDMMDTPSDGIVRNKDIIFFPEAEHYGWGQITHFGIFTAASGGKPIFWGALSSPVQIPKNYIPIFRAKKLQIGLDNDPATST